MRRPVTIFVTLLLSACAAPAGPPAAVPAPSAGASVLAPTSSTRPSPPAPTKASAPAPTDSSTPAIAPSPRGTASAAGLPAGLSAVIPVADGPVELAATSDAIWVEAHRANILARIDPAQDLEIARLTDVPVHCEVAAGAGFVWATQASSGTITKVDPTTGEVVAKIRLGEACGVAADETGVWATSPGAGRAIRYDPDTLDIQANIVLGPLAFSVAMGPDAVWVMGEADGGTLWRIDPQANELEATIAVPVRFATGVDVGFGSVWVPGREERVVYRIDPATNAIEETIEMPAAVGGIGIGPDALWASGFGDGTLHRIDPTTNEVTGSIETGYGNLGPPIVAFESVWVGALDRNVVLRVDPSEVQD